MNNTQANLSSLVVKRSLGEAEAFLAKSASITSPETSHSNSVALGVIMMANLYEQMGIAKRKSMSILSDSNPLTFVVVASSLNGFPIAIMFTAILESHKDKLPKTNEYLTVIGPRGSKPEVLRAYVAAALKSIASENGVGFQLISSRTIKP